MARSDRCDVIGFTWLGIVAVSLVALLLLVRPGRRGLAFWVPVWATRSSYARTILRRLPAVLVSTNPAVGGLLAINLPLINWHVSYCGFSTFAVPQWWAIAVLLGAWVAGLLFYVYHAWAVRRGFTAWSALLWDTSEAKDGPTTVSSPPWRRLWPWIVLSFVLLIAGMVLGVMGTSLAAGGG